MSDGKGTGSLIAAPGENSLREILSQPEFWNLCLQKLHAANKAAALKESLSNVTEWLFIGCGSSYYVGLSAAATWSLLTGQRARAVPASELLLFPDLVRAGSGKTAAVLISRSGTTSETVKAAELLAGDDNVYTLAVTGTTGEILERLATYSLALAPSEEESTVMTRSFTSMLLGLQYLAAAWAGDQTVSASLLKLPSVAGTTLDSLHPRIRDFVGAHSFADYVCLGQGPFYGLACEAALKITEMSVSYAQSFHTLEFRHGPKSIVGPETLVVFLLSEQGYDAEVAVLEEVKYLGGTTLAITNRADARARSSSDLLIEFGFDLPELARLAPHIFAGQLLGLYVGLKKRLDPDNPRHLSRVVMLK